NIPANAKICKAIYKIPIYIFNIVFADSEEDYENFLKSGKYDTIYIPIFYAKEGETKDYFKVMDYNKLSLRNEEFLITYIDPKTCE
ncbi:hypothetical protein, partial [Campylobacter sp. MIT 97-5078]